MEKSLYEQILGDLVEVSCNPSSEKWKEMIEKYDMPYHADSLRKAWHVTEYGGKAVYDYFMTKNKDIDGIKELEKIKEDIIKERKKLQATKLEYNRNLTHDGRFELFYENVKDVFESISNPTFEELYVEDGSKCHVVGIADIHYGANFISENNTYSIEECERRFNVLLNKIVKHIQKEQISHIKVINGADSIQGILRMSDLRLNETSVVNAVVGVSKLIASFLNELSRYCAVEYIHAGAANHSQTRPLGSKASEIATEDMEKLIINYIHDVLANNDRVNVHMTDGSDRVFFNIFGFECALLHGHQIKNVKSSLKDLSMLHRRFFDYVFLAHRHASQQIVVGESDVNAEVITMPSFVGSDPYSDSLMCGAKAMAQIYVFDEYEGHIETKNLILN